MDRYARAGEALANLVREKNRAYGSSFASSGEFLRLLYPHGVQPAQYGDMLIIVRIFDKMMRIATHKEALGENPFLDIGGYGMLGGLPDLAEEDAGDGLPHAAAAGGAASDPDTGVPAREVDRGGEGPGAEPSV